MGRNVGSHADGDSGGAVYQKIRHFGRQHRGLPQRPIVIGLPVDRVLVDVLLQHFFRELGQPHLGVAHGRGGVAVDGAEVALAVHQRISHREILSHPHHGVVDSCITMRVVLTHYLAHDAGRLLVGFSGCVAALPHSVEHSSMYRLQTIADVRQGAPDDHAHGVIDIASLHLLFDIDRYSLIEGENSLLVAHRCPIALRTSKLLAAGHRPAGDHPAIPRLAAQISRFLTLRAFSSMNTRRGSTLSPIKTVKIWSAPTSSSMRTWSSRRFSGSMVVSHS